VNAAWRLQERSKEHPGEILIGEAVARLIEPEFHSSEAGSLTVGGSLEVSYSLLTVAHREEQRATAAECVA